MHPFRGSILASATLALGCAGDVIPAVEAPRHEAKIVRDQAPRGRLSREAPGGYGRSFPVPPPAASAPLLATAAGGMIPMHRSCSPVHGSVGISECDAIARATAMLEREGYLRLPASAASVHPTRREVVACAATDGVGSESSCATLTLTRRNGSVDVSKPQVGLNQGHWFVSFAAARTGASPVLARMQYDGKDLEIAEEPFADRAAAEQRGAEPAP
jgi:hypothetical protein